MPYGDRKGSVFLSKAIEKRCIAHNKGFAANWLSAQLWFTKKQELLFFCNKVSSKKDTV